MEFTKEELTTIMEVMENHSDYLYNTLWDERKRMDETVVKDMNDEITHVNSIIEKLRDIAQTVATKPKMVKAHRITFTYTVDVPKSEVEDQDEAYGLAFSEFCVNCNVANCEIEEVEIEEE